MLKFERKSLSLILLTLILIFSIIIIIIIEHNYDNDVYVDSKRHTNNRQLLSSDIQIIDGQPIKTYNGIVPLTKCPAGIFQIYSIYYIFIY